MKRIAIVATMVAATLGSVGVASAAGVEFDVGRGGVYVGPNYHHRHWHHGYRAYGYERDCRVVVTHRINGHGDRVTVRRRICD